MAPRLPGAEALGAPPSARSGRMIADIDLQAEGRGIAAFGRGVQSVAVDIAADQERKRKESNALDLARAEAFATTKLTEFERGFNSDPDYETYETRFNDGADKTLEEAAGIIRDPKVRELWSTKKTEEIAASRNRVLTRADSLGRERKRVDYDESLVPHRDILADPTMPEDRRTIARQNLENGIRIGETVGLYSPAQAAERREKLVRGSILNREVMRAETDPDAVLRESSVAGRIVSVEKGSTPDARPVDPKTGEVLSSAMGNGQFIKSTWLSTIAKHRPDLVSGKSEDEILALRADPDLSFQMTEAHAKDNAAYLESKGIANPGDGAVYLAHFAGAGGAEKLLKADPGASAESILGADAVKANKFLAGKTAGEVVEWASRKMGAANPYADLTPEERFKVTETATRARTLRETQARKERTEFVATQKNDLKIRIMDGKAGVADIEAARSDWLTDADDIKGLYDFVNTVETGMAVNRAAQEKFSDASSIWDATDANDKKRVDALFGDGASALAARDDGFVSASLLPIVERSAMVPREAKGALVTMVRSRDPATVQFALETMDRIEQTNPEAFRRDMGDDAQKKLLTWRAQSPYRRPEEIVEELRNADDPATASARAQLEKDALDPKKVDPVPDDDILDHFGAGDTQIPLVAGSLRHDFDRLYSSEYARTGDPEQAKDNALKLLSNAWGSTSVGDGGRLMRYPPESIYPRVNGSHDWVREQAEAELRPVVGEGRSFVLVTDPRTEAEIKRGARPSYAVVARDENGVYSAVTDESGRAARIDFDYRPAEDEAIARADLDRAYETAGVPEREALRAEIRDRATAGNPMTVKEAAARRAELRAATLEAQTSASRAIAAFGRDEPLGPQEAAAGTIQSLAVGGI